MKRQRIIKTLVIMLSIVLITTFLFSGCGKNESEGKEDTGTDQTDVSTDENKEASDADDAGDNETKIFTYWKALSKTHAQFMQSLSENMAYQELEKRTGITMEFIHPPIGQEEEQYNIMIASDDLPDIIEHEGDAEYPGGPDKAIEEEAFIRLNELIDEHAPNYKRFIESEEYAKEAKTDEGNIWAFCMISTRTQPVSGPVIRKDWLDDLGLDMPETIDDWYEVLKAFKEEKGATAPLYLLKEGTWGEEGHWISAFDVNRGFFQIDGDVKFGPIEEGYKDYLATMNEWYEEGLLDKEFASTGDWDNLTPYIITGKSGATRLGFWEMNAAVEAAEDPDFELVAAPNPSLESGKKPHFRQREKVFGSNPTVITTNCDDPVAAVKWFDYMYSDEGTLLANYGVEGETFEWENKEGTPKLDKKGDNYEWVGGEPKYTDLIADNPDGLSLVEATHKYLIHSGPCLRQIEREHFAFPDYAIDAMMNVWNDSADVDYMLPDNITLTAAEGEKISEIMTDVNTYVDEMTVKLIMGEEPISNFDEYVEQIKKMRIDEAIQIYQDALDRYKTR